VHVGFALALPTVYKALEKAGFRLPKHQSAARG